MSIRIMSAVWAVSEASKTELLCLLALADHANDDGYCWPSVKTVARKCRISERQCQRLLATLESKGDFARQDRIGTTIFQLSDRFVKCRGGDTHVTGGVTPMSPGGDIAMSPESSRNHQEKPSEDILLNSQLCEKLYSLYPRHIGRANALRAISQALKKVSAADLLAAVERYAAAVKTWPDKDRAFVPHPATWFNQERWLDDRKEWQRGTRGQQGDPDEELRDIVAFSRRKQGKS